MRRHYHRSLSTKFSHRICSRLSSSKVRCYTKTAVLCFWAPFAGLRGNVRWSSLTHWKAGSGLPISVNWIFFPRCYGWGATSEYRFKIRRYRFNGDRLTQKFQVEGEAPPSIVLIRKAKWSFVWYKHLDRSFFGCVTIHAFDGRTDRHTDIQTDTFLIASLRLYSMQRRKNIYVHCVQ